MKNDPQDHDQTSGKQAVMESITKRMGAFGSSASTKIQASPLLEPVQEIVLVSMHFFHSKMHFLSGSTNKVINKTILLN